MRFKSFQFRKIVHNGSIAK